MRSLTRARAGAAARMAAAFLWASAARGEVFYLNGMAVDDLAPTSGAPSFRSGIPSFDEVRQRLVRRGDNPYSVNERPRTLTEQQLAAQHLKRAENYLRANDLPKALLELRDGLAYDPNQPQLLSRAAVLTASRQEFSRSAYYYRRFLEQRPEDVFHLAGYAAVLLRLTRLDEMEEVLRRAEEVNPDYMPTRFNRACLDLVRERRNLPKDYWKRCALEEIELVSVWLRSDRESLERVMGQEDLRLLCETVLGPGTYARLDQIGETFRAYREAQAVPDRDAMDRALAEVQEAGVFGAGIDLARAELAYQSGRTGEAMERWQALPRRFPSWAEAWLSLGHALLRMGEYPRAVVAMEKANELSPDNVLGRFLLGCTYAMAGEPLLAKPLVDEVALVHAESMRKWVDAEPLLDTALKKLPNYSLLMRRMGIPPEAE